MLDELSIVAQTPLFAREEEFTLAEAAPVEELIKKSPIAPLRGELMPAKKPLKLWVTGRERPVVSNLAPRDREEWGRECPEPRPLIMGIRDRDEERPKLSRLWPLEETARFVEGAGDLTPLEEVEKFAPLSIVSNQDEHVTRPKTSARLSFSKPERLLRLEEKTPETLSECAPICFR